MKAPKEEAKDPFEFLASALMPPPEEIYRSKVTVKHECVNYGLNMYFKSPHEFSADPDQAGGDLATN